MPILRIDQFPDGSGAVSNDDLILFLDNPSGSSTTKYMKISDMAGATYKHYGSFYDTTIQTNVNVSGINTIKINSTNISSGISIASGTRLLFANSGIYNIQFSAQIEKTDGGDDTIEIWLSKNGSGVADSNTSITLHQQDAKTVAAWNFLVSANSNDYYELKWYSTDPGLIILAQSGLTNPNRPEIPSIILTAVQV
jgi:hypothetical protein